MIDGWTEEQHEPTVRHERPAAPQDVRRVMLLGSAEPSRELAIALQGLGAEVIAVTAISAPAHRIADQSVVVTMTDAEELTAVIRRLQPDFLVTVTAAVSVDALDAVEQADGECTELVPNARAVRCTADREGLRRLAADQLGTFHPVRGSSDPLANFKRWPSMLGFRCW
ncbi:phosphoribosylglycinamide formyltransferase 2 [Mycobacterium tuberculosis CAS/NITR204]|uniref:Phosphoribosylglycinamide formyltransferase 2 n=1 Tax=Mycobacterium tuberculosis CAS/NITR204 TaxID=1310114 RepID=R4M9R5_MYCTX|nr:phosphoribosylglycinamide formyltransferase 2 [Mycobacterium tuberculosis CAS/NITR204]